MPLTAAEREALLAQLDALEDAREAKFDATFAELNSAYTESIGEVRRDIEQRLSEIDVGAAATPPPAEPKTKQTSEPPPKGSSSELNAMSKPKLVGWAKENLGLDLDVAERKEELLAAIEEALTQRNAEG